jgi:hypothetical protein
VVFLKNSLSIKKLLGVKILLNAKIGDILAVLLRVRRENV